MKLKQKALEIVRDSKKAVEVEFLAQKLGINWSTARVFLQELTIEGELESVATTGRNVYVAIEKHAVNS